MLVHLVTDRIKYQPPYREYSRPDQWR